MRHSIFSLALICVPLSLAACTTDEDMPEDGMADESSGDTDDSDSDTEDDTMTSEGESDTDDESDGEDPEACNVPSPYMGGWDVGCCQDTIVQNGWSPGNVSAGSILPDWTMADQFGDNVRLWDFCHDAIYFEYSSVW